MNWLMRVVFVLLLGVAAGARGTPANRAGMERHFGEFLAKNLRTCSVCHLPSEKKDPETLEEFPHNAFGEAVRKAGVALRAEGQKRERGARLEIIGEADSDGDGVGDLAELWRGRNPGEAEDVRLWVEIKTLEGRRGAYAVFLKSYRWEPFEVVKRPAVPVPAKPQAALIRNAIDAFVEEQRAMRGLVAVGEAPRL